MTASHMLNLVALKRLHDSVDEAFWPLTDSLGFIYRTGFAYDSIDDADIDSALKSATRLLRAWTKMNKDFASGKTIESTLKPVSKATHIERVAALVSLFRSGVIPDPIIMEYGGASFSEPSCVSDGHHRVRAYQFLGEALIPASVGGYARVIEWLESYGVLHRL